MMELRSDNAICAVHLSCHLAKDCDVCICQLGVLGGANEELYCTIHVCRSSLQQYFLQLWRRVMLSLGPINLHCQLILLRVRRVGACVEQ